MRQTRSALWSSPANTERLERQFRARMRLRSKLRNPRARERRLGCLFWPAANSKASQARHTHTHKPTHTPQGAHQKHKSAHNTLHAHPSQARAQAHANPHTRSGSTPLLHQKPCKILTTETKTLTYPKKVPRKEIFLWFFGVWGQRRPRVVPKIPPSPFQGLFLLKFVQKRVSGIVFL
jgi:hypothetical protein